MDLVDQLTQWGLELPRWAYELAFVAYALTVIPVVVLERRRPTATLAWILTLIFVPLLGLAAYILFGRTRVRRRRRERSRRSVHALAGTRNMANLEAIPNDFSGPLRGLIRLAIRGSAAPLRRADSLDLLATPDAAYEAVKRAISSARHYIHMEFYIWQDDATGQEITALLAERARAGISVRVLYDHVGSLSTRASHFAELRAAGGQVAVFGKVRFPFRLRQSRVNFRNHRKLVVVDGEIGFLGGLNIGNEYLGSRHRTRWRDLLVQMSGDALVGLEAIFVDDWLASTGQVLNLSGAIPPGAEGADARRPPRRPRGRKAKAKASPDEPGTRKTSRLRRRRLATHDNPFHPPPNTPVESRGPIMQIIPSGPDTEVTGAIAAQFSAAISMAQFRAWIATPYFIPDETLSLILRTAAMRGVDVRILVPAPDESDQRLVALASRSYYDELMQAGCRIYEYQPGMLHSKYLVVDDMLAAIGSANMDIRSFHINYEVTAMVYDRRFTDNLAKLFNEDLAASREIGHELRGDLSVSSRLAEGFARVLSPLL